MDDDTPTGDTCWNCGKTYAELDYWPLWNERDWAPFCNSKCRQAYKPNRDASAVLRMIAACVDDITEANRPRTPNAKLVTNDPQTAMFYLSRGDCEEAVQQLRNETGWDWTFATCKDTGSGKPHYIPRVTVGGGNVYLV